MPRFFTDDIHDDVAIIGGEDARHILRSLRCHMGEELTLCSNGSDYRCAITALGEDTVTLRVLEQCRSLAEPPVRITLYQAMPKGDKAELIIQKAVELGASRIVLLLTARCVARPEPRAMEKKLERFNKIAQQAAKQCGRGAVPMVEGLLTLAQTLEQLRGEQAGVLFYENATQPLGGVLAQKPASIGVLIGPEGGFEPQEVQAAQAVGLSICTMGPRILRCETAPLYALSAITYHYENMM